MLALVKKFYQLTTTAKQHYYNKSSHQLSTMVFYLVIAAEESSYPGGLPQSDRLRLCRVPIGGEHPGLELGEHLLLRGCRHLFHLDLFVLVHLSH